MRAKIQGRKIIQKGDTTTTGGAVIGASAWVKQAQGVACKGDPVFCPACKTTGSIAEGSPLLNIQGVAVALEGHRVNCGCPNGSRLVAS
jgi:uncharacterized Zn-binding protein involved in type VI secretion